MTSTGWAGVADRITNHRQHRSPERLQNNALRGAQLAKDLLIEDMSQPKSGDLYVGSRVPASVEGETPAMQSNELAEKTDAVRGEKRPGLGTAYLDSKGKHAIWMEFGWTTADGQVHYRPFHRTFVAGRKDELIAEMQKGM